MDTVISNVATGLLTLTNAQLLSRGEVFNDVAQTQIKIGKDAGVVQATNSIILNATGAALSNNLSTDSSSCFIKPIKSKDAISKEVLLYNTTTGEVTSTAMSNISSGSEAVAITGATASDTWTITTNNAAGALYPQVTCALDPAAASAISAKQSPIFTAANQIVTTTDWPVGTGWLISASSYHENSPGHQPSNAADSVQNSVWTSGNYTFSGGVGDQFWQIQYPSAVNVLSFQFQCAAPSSAPTTFSLSYSDNGIDWIVAQNYNILASAYVTDWTTVPPQTVPPVGVHRYFRIRVTRNVSLPYVQMENIRFFTGFTAAGLKLSSVLPISSSQFKLVMTDVIGTRLTPANIPIALPFYITLIKAGKIVNTGLYTISTAGVITTA